MRPQAALSRVRFDASRAITGEDGHRLPMGDFFVHPQAICPAVEFATGSTFKPNLRMTSGMVLSQKAKLVCCKCAIGGRGKGTAVKPRLMDAGLMTSKFVEERKCGRAVRALVRQGLPMNLSPMQAKLAFATKDTGTGGTGYAPFDDAQFVGRKVRKFYF